MGLHQSTVSDTIASGSTLTAQQLGNDTPSVTRFTFADYLMFASNVSLILGDGSTYESLPSNDIGSVRYYVVDHVFTTLGTFQATVRYEVPGKSPTFYRTQVTVSEAGEGTGPRTLLVKGQGQNIYAKVSEDVPVWYTEFKHKGESIALGIDYGDGTAEPPSVPSSTNELKTTHRWGKPGTYFVTGQTYLPGLEVAKTVATPIIVSDGSTQTVRAAQTAVDSSTVELTWTQGATFCPGPAVRPCTTRVPYESNSGRAHNGLVWNFGDGTLLTDAPRTVQHRYQQPGTYTVSLSYGNVTGQTTITVPIGNPPPSTTVQVTGVTVGGQSVPVTGSYTMTQNQTIQFAGIGPAAERFTLRLTPKSGNGKSITKQVTIDRNGTWQVQFSNLRRAQYTIDAVVGSTTTGLGTLTVLGPIR